jgi:hypothetical protein
MIIEKKGLLYTFGGLVGSIWVHLGVDGGRGAKVAAKTLYVWQFDLEMVVHYARKVVLAYIDVGESESDVSLGFWKPYKP